MATSLSPSPATSAAGSGLWCELAPGASRPVPRARARGQVLSLREPSLPRSGGRCRVGGEARALCSRSVLAVPPTALPFGEGGPPCLPSGAFLAGRGRREGGCPHRPGVGTLTLLTRGAPLGLAACPCLAPTRGLAGFSPHVGWAQLGRGLPLPRLSRGGGGAGGGGGAAWHTRVLLFPAPPDPLLGAQRNPPGTPWARPGLGAPFGALTSLFSHEPGRGGQLSPLCRLANWGPKGRWAQSHLGSGW